MARYTAVLKGGAPWGFRLQGGRDTGAPLTVAKINPNSKAAQAHIRKGDVVEIVNNKAVYNLTNKDAINLVHGTPGDLELVLCRQTGMMNGTSDNNVSTTSTTKTTIHKPDPSACTDNEIIELDGVTLQGFSPSNVSVVKTTTTKVTKITRSESPSPSQMTQGSITFVGGDSAEPVRCSGDGMPNSTVIPARYQEFRRGRQTPPSPTKAPAASPIRVVHVNGSRAPPKPDSIHHRSTIHIPRISTGSIEGDQQYPTPRQRAFSPPPPVPPSPTESVESFVPMVPPKPRVTKTNIVLSANQGQEEIDEPPPPRILEPGQFVPPPSAAQISRQPKPNYNINNNDESWPAPPPPSATIVHPSQVQQQYHQPPPVVHRPSEVQQHPNPSDPHVWTPPSKGPPPPIREKPLFRPVTAPKSGKPAVWSPSSQPSHTIEPSHDTKDPSLPVWSPTGTTSIKPKGYKPVKLDLNSRQPRPSVEGASDSGSVRSNDDSATNPSYISHPPPIRTSPSDGSSEVYRPTNVTEQFSRPPPQPVREQYKSINAPQEQYAPEVPPAPVDGRPRTASDPGSAGDQLSPEGMRQVPNGYGVHLPRSVSPTVTLLQYQRDDDLKDQIRYGHPGSDVLTDPSQLPEGAVYQTKTHEGDVVHTDTYFPIKQVTTKKERKLVEAPTYDGIGPRDKSGLPLGLRQHVKETNRHDWYKEMFKSIHKRDEEEDDYKPGSQPEGVLARPKAEVDAKWDPQRYQAQPRSIEKYAPGASSLAAKDKTPNANMYNPPPEPITAAQFGSRRNQEPLRREIRRQVEAAGSPHRSIDDSQIANSPREPPIGQSKPHAATLPRLPKPRSSGSDSGLSAVERLGIKSPPPTRTKPTRPTTQNASQKERERVLSGGDRLYNYRNPPSTLDRTTAERLIEEERQKRKLADRDNQALRRHSDYKANKPPIITNDRFNDLLGEEPKPVDKPLPKWKQEEIAKKAVATTVESSPPPTSPLSPELKACALALYSFKAQTAKELSFNKGDTLYLRRDIDKNWFEGEHHGCAGIFPKAYVETITSIEEARLASLTSPSTDGKARAKYKFKGETQLELTFNKGDIIDLVKKIDDNWWDARQGNRTGIVPSSYLDIIREPTAITSPASKSPIHSAPPSAVNSTPTHNRVASTDQYQYPSVMSSPSTAASSGGRSAGPRSMWDKDSYSLGVETKPQSGTGAPVHVVDPRGLMEQLQDKYKAVYPYLPNNDDELELEEGDIVLVMEKCDDGWFVGTSTRTHMFGTFPGNYVELIR